MMVDTSNVDDEHAPSVAPQHQNPGIHFSSVVVDRLAFTDIGPDERKPDSLQFNFGIQRRRFEDESLREVSVVVRILPALGQTSRLSLDAVVTGRFQKLDGPGVMAFDEFAKANAPALVMPYVRELVTNITARSRHGAIIFPPVNVVKLVAEEQASAEVPKPDV